MQRATEIINNYDSFYHNFISFNSMESLNPYQQMNNHLLPQIIE